MDFRDITIAELVAGVHSGEHSAEAVARSTLARLDAENGRLNAFVARVPEATVLAEARAVDAAVARGEEPGPLAGVPVGVKDLEDVRGLPTCYGSALWADAPPAARDSLLVARMRAAGAVVVGKTNTPEFGCKGATDNPAFGATANPWSLEHSPGGSSGGSSAALAAGLVPLATGSDGGGSIRIPASVCGHSGFKATQGRVPLADPSGRRRACSPCVAPWRAPCVTRCSRSTCFAVTIPVTSSRCPTTTSPGSPPTTSAACP